jgi:hypothetical protein
MQRITRAHCGAIGYGKGQTGEQKWQTDGK